MPYSRAVEWSDRGHRRLAQIAIVVIVFPVLVEVMQVLIGYPVLLVLSPILSRISGNSVVISRIIIGVLLIVEAAAAFSLCRLVWPKPKPGPVNSGGADAGA